MNLIDILVLATLGYGVYKGFRNGVIIEVAGLLGIIVGIWAGMRLAFIFANYYRDNFDLPENYIPLIAFITAFLLGVGVIILVGKVATMVIKTAQLNLVNRVAGGAFALLKWAFLFGSLLSMIGNSELLSDEVKEGSASYPVITKYCSVVQGYSIGLIPKARNVFDDMENYFVGLDSVRNARQADSMAVDSINNPENN